MRCGPGGGRGGPGWASRVTTNRVEIEKERLGLSGAMGPQPVSQSVLSGDEIVTTSSSSAPAQLCTNGNVLLGQAARQAGWRVVGALSTVTSVSCNTLPHQHSQSVRQLQFNNRNNHHHQTTNILRGYSGVLSPVIS